MKLLHYFLINNVIVTLCWWSVFFFFLSNRTNRMHILQKKFTRMAYNWLGILKMALWRLEKPLSPWDWKPQPSEYGTECLEDFWRGAGLQSTLELREAAFRWWRKVAAGRQTHPPARSENRGGLVFSVDFFISGLPLWGMTPFLPLIFLQHAPMYLPKHLSFSWFPIKSN